MTTVARTMLLTAALVIAGCGRAIFEEGEPTADAGVLPAEVPDAGIVEEPDESGGEDETEGDIDEEPDPSELEDAGVGEADAGVETDAGERDAGPDEPDDPPPNRGLLTSSTDLNVYRGDLHVHSSYSNDAAQRPDPPGPPSECFARARRKGLDFLGLSDHVTWGWATTEERERCLDQARDATGPGFLAMCGMETSVAQPGADNHANVFFYNGPFNPFSRFLSHRAFFDTLHSKAGALGQFNHPSGAKFRWMPPDYSARVDGDMELIELNGGTDTASRRAKYVQFLNKGWHVAPTLNSDTHSGGETGQTALWARSLRLEDIKEAIVGHRTFVHSSNGDRAGRVKFFAENYWMGATLEGLTSARIRVVAFHPRGIAKIEIIGPGGELGTALETLHCANVESCVKSTTLARLPRWIFVKVHQSNGGWMLTAPMWFK